MAIKKRFSGWFAGWGKYTLSLKTKTSDRRRVRVAFNIYPLPTPFGGAQEFLKQFARYIVWHGGEVVHELDPEVTHIFILDVRRIETYTFDLEDIRRFKQKFPDVQVIHRINNCDKKYTAADYDPGAERLDQEMIRASDIADHTVFISGWLRDYFMQEGFNPDLSHSVIQNAANDDIFYVKSTRAKRPAEIRLVTHHWSANWLKGFKVYQQVDEMISAGELPGFSLTVIGRQPEEIQWKSADIRPPASGAELADQLREHDMYLTASLWEPGGMHFLEGMQCGLPVIFHEDGGGIPEIAGRAGVGFRDDVKAALMEAAERYEELKALVLEQKPSGEGLCQQFGDLVFPDRQA